MIDDDNKEKEKVFLQTKEYIRSWKIKHGRNPDLCDKICSIHTYSTSHKRRPLCVLQSDMCSDTMYKIMLQNAGVLEQLELFVEDAK
jgi:hypothetical protein